MGITAEFTVGCIGVLTAGAITMELDGEHRRTACAARLQVLSSSLCRGSVIRDCQRKHPDPGKRSELRLPPSHFERVIASIVDKFCPGIRFALHRRRCQFLNLSQCRVRR